MPIPEKIQAAKSRYDEKLKEVQKLVLAENKDPDFEKVTINLLLDMTELKTEMVILDRVLKHQASVNS